MQFLNALQRTEFTILHGAEHFPVSTPPMKEPEMRYENIILDSKHLLRLLVDISSVIASWRGSKITPCGIWSSTLLCTVLRKWLGTKENQGTTQWRSFRLPEGARRHDKFFEVFGCDGNMAAMAQFILGARARASRKYATSEDWWTLPAHRW